MLVLPASLTHREAPDAVQMLVQTLRREPPGAGVVSVDASALRQFDSSALAVLLECQRQAVALGRRVELRHAPPRLRQLAGVYGVEALFAAPADTGPGPSPGRPPGPSSGLSPGSTTGHP